MLPPQPTLQAHTNWPQALPPLTTAHTPLQDGHMRALLLRFHIDPRACVPAGALDGLSLEIAAEIAAVLSAGGPRATIGDGTARATAELRRLADEFDVGEVEGP